MADQPAPAEREPDQPSSPALTSFAGARGSGPGAVTAWENITWAILAHPEIGHPVTDSGKTRVVQYPGAAAHGEPTITRVDERTGSEEIMRVGVKFEEGTYAASGQA